MRRATRPRHANHRIWSSPRDLYISSRALFVTSSWNCRTSDTQGPASRFRKGLGFRLGFMV
jgi:hypothetical protein